MCIRDSIVIAYLLSNNRKNIDWKTIGLGLLSQLIIAVGVIKVDAVKIFFEKIGQVFLMPPYLILYSKVIIYLLNELLDTAQNQITIPNAVLFTKSARL